MRSGILCVFVVTLALGTNSTPIRRSGVKRPNTLYMDGDDMLYLRSHPEEVIDAVSDIVRRADSYRSRRVETVLDKGIAPPFRGAERNDYFSFSPYWWEARNAPCLDENLCFDKSSAADDKKRHELLMESRHTLTHAQFERLNRDFAPAAERKCFQPDEWMKCDGMVNDHGGLKHDKDVRSIMLSAVYSGAMAFWYTGDERYGEMAANWMKAWFVNPETRMNPRMTYAQGIPGTDISGQKYGLIEMQRLPLDVFECAELLVAGHSKHWSDSDHKALQKWQADFLTWMKSSDMATLASETHNNHATWEAFLRFYLGARSQKPVDVRAALGDITTNVMDTQFSYDGILPYETYRPRSRHYYAYGLLPLVRVASIVKKFYDRYGDTYADPHYSADYVFNYRNRGTHVTLLEGMSKIHSYATEAEKYTFPDTDKAWLKLESGSIFGYEEIVLIGNKYAPSIPTNTYVRDLKRISGYQKGVAERSALRLMFRLDRV